MSILSILCCLKKCFQTDCIGVHQQGCPCPSRPQWVEGSSQAVGLANKTKQNRRERPQNGLRAPAPLKASVQHCLFVPFVQQICPADCVIRLLCVKAHILLTCHEHVACKLFVSHRPGVILFRATVTRNYTVCITGVGM